MIRIRFAACACLLLLAGCAHDSSRRVHPRHYTLSEAAPTVRRHPHQTESRATLQVARISAPSWLQGTDLLYRLAYRHADRIASYGLSDWAAPPAQLLQSMVLGGLADGSAWAVVVGPDSAAKTDYGLFIRLDDFSQIFVRPQQSLGTLDATATLIDNRDDRVVAQKRFRFRIAAPSADAAGGAAALTRASRQFVARLRQWLRQASPRDRAGPAR